MRSLQIITITTVLVIQVLSQRYRPETNFRQQSSYNNVQNNQQPQRSNVACPEPDGRFPTRTCDGYIECKDGIGEEKICPDGLLFNPKTGPFAFPCQYPIDVDCSGREQTQPAQATDECPHQFGYYRLGDAQNCGQFKNCADGRGYVFDCPEGLAFNEQTYRCDWPDQVESCDAENYLGFKCPQIETRQYGLGDEEYRYFRSPNDCQRYYICINGKPRLYNCGDGRAFNDLINVCDGIENVTGCAIPERNLPNQQYKITNYRG